MAPCECPNSPARKPDPIKDDAKQHFELVAKFNIETPTSRNKILSTVNFVKEGCRIKYLERQGERTNLSVLKCQISQNMQL